MDLASKDSYIQKFASKVFSQRDQEPKKRPFAHFKGQNDTGAPKKKKKCKKKHFKEKGGDEKKPTQKPQQKPSAVPGQQKSPAGKLNESKAESVNGATAQTPAGGNVKSNFSTVDVLRKRLHEKIEQSRGQGAPKDASSEAVQAKRAKRKLERERKKRKRKEFRMKKLAEESGQEQQPEIKQEVEQTPAASKRNETAIVFNKVETVEEGYGDEGKAREMEEKMRWTNMLYKAEGLKIKDDEEMLRASLKRKEKRRDQRKKQWNKRSENIVEKMQQRQDKRRRNIQKQKNAKTEKKKNRARKRGRVLPEDLKKAAV